MSKEHKAILWLLALAMFLVVLDSAIINVALPAIKTSLNFTTTSLQWVLTSYILTFGGFLMFAGRTADLYGRRKVLVWGLAGFSIFSLLVGLSTTSTMLIILRGLQGLAGAFMAPTALSILLATFKEGPERYKAMSVWSVVASGGAAAGVFLGGLLTQYLGWQWCFFVNVPLGFITIAAIMKYIPAHIQESKDKHLDLPGAVLVTAGLMSLVYALTLAAQFGWGSNFTLLTFGLSAVLLVAFLINESKSKHPLVPLSIFKVRNIVGGNLTMLPVVAGALGMFFFTTLYIQNILKLSPFETGLSFLPVPFIIGVISYNSPRLLNRFPIKSLAVAGLILTTIGIFMMTFLNENSSYLVNVLPAFIMLAFGFGISFVSIAVASTSGVPAEDSGLASGLINTSQQVGAALGLAILTVVASTAIKADLMAGRSSIQANVHGYQQAFLYATLLLLAGLLVTIFVVKVPKDVKPEQPQV